MIQHDITHLATAPVHACGATAHIIESRGRTRTDPRLLGLPARQFHVECCTCRVASVPQFSVGMALKAWKTGQMVPDTQLPQLRAELEAAQVRMAVAA